MAKSTTTATNKVATTKKASAPAAPKKAASPLVPDAKGNYPLLLYSVRNKAFVDLAKKPLPVLTTTGRGAFMCKGSDTDGNTLAMIIGKAVAANWVSRKLAEYAPGSEPE